MKIAQHRPFFLDPAFFPSPPKPLQLPVYVEAIAKQFETHDPKPTPRARSKHPRVLTFIDHSAIESDSESSPSNVSSISGSSSSTLH